MPYPLLLKFPGPFGAPDVPDPDPPEEPGEPGDTIVTTTLEPYSTQPFVNQHIMRGCTFAKGKVPAGNRVVATQGNQQFLTQLDSEVRWPDGSLRVATVTYLKPATTGADEEVTLKVLSGAQNHTGLSLADFLAWANSESWEVEWRFREAGLDWSAKAKLHGLESGRDLAGAATWDYDSSAIVGQWMRGPIVTCWRVWVVPMAGAVKHRGLRCFFDIYVFTDAAGNVINTEVDRTVENSSLYHEGQGTYFLEEDELLQNGVVRWSRYRETPAFTLAPARIRNEYNGKNNDRGDVDINVTDGAPFEHRHVGRIIRTSTGCMANINSLRSASSARCFVSYGPTNILSTTSSSVTLDERAKFHVSNGRAYPQLTGANQLRIEFSGATGLEITLVGEDVLGNPLNITYGPMNGAGEIYTTEKWMFIDSIAKSGTGTYEIGFGGFPDSNRDGVPDTIPPGDWWIEGSYYAHAARDTRTVQLHPRIEVNVHYPDDYLIKNYAIQTCLWSKAENLITDNSGRISTAGGSGSRQDYYDLIWADLGGEGEDDKNHHQMRQDVFHSRILGRPAFLRSHLEFHIWPHHELIYGQQGNKRAWTTLMRFSKLVNWWPIWFRDPATGTVLDPEDPNNPSRAKYRYGSENRFGWNPTPGDTSGISVPFGLFNHNAYDSWYGFVEGDMNSHDRLCGLLAPILTGKLYLWEHFQMWQQSRYLLAFGASDGYRREMGLTQSRWAAMDIHALGCALSYHPENWTGKCLLPREPLLQWWRQGIERALHDNVLVGPNKYGTYFGTPSNVSPDKWRYDIVVLDINNDGPMNSHWMDHYTLEAMAAFLQYGFVSQKGMDYFKHHAKMYMRAFSDTDNMWWQAFTFYLGYMPYTGYPAAGAAGLWHTQIDAFPGEIERTTSGTSVGGTVTLSDRTVGSGRRITATYAMFRPSNKGSLFVFDDDRLNGLGRFDNIDADLHGADVTILQSFPSTSHTGGLFIQYTRSGVNTNPGLISGVGSLAYKPGIKTLHGADWYTHGTICVLAAATYHPELRAEANQLFDMVEQWAINDYGQKYLDNNVLSDDITYRVIGNTLLPRR